MFRLYSHEKAWKGAEQLKEYLDKDLVVFESSTTLTELLDFKSMDGSKKEEFDHRIRNDTLIKLSERLVMPPNFIHQVKRARKQYLKKHVTAV